MIDVVSIEKRSSYRNHWEINFLQVSLTIETKRDTMVISQYKDSIVYLAPDAMYDTLICLISFLNSSNGIT